MSLTTLSAIAATIIFTSFAVMVAVGMIIDVLGYIAENFTDDEVREVPVECNQKVMPDDFDTLYINVARGDKSDFDYWLDSVKGNAEND